MIDDQQNRDDVLTPGAEVNDRIVRRGALAPKLPKDFKVERQGSALRLRVTDQNRTTARSGTVSYLCGWADGVDTTTKAGLDAGAARIEMFPLLAAPGVDDQDVTLYLADTRYQTGVFYCFAVDRDGGRSTDYLWSQSLTSEITDATVPADVTHPQVSGSGEYVGADVVEALSVSCRAPLPIGSFDGVQLYLKDYINLGTTQEGEFHRHNGQPGGSLQFKVNYQLSKRQGTGTSITVTNSSTAVTGIGTQFTTQCQAGDYLEVGQHRAQIASVNGDTSITLTGWAWLTLTTTDFAFYGKVRVFLVSVSKGGTRRTDITLSPFVDLVFDGSLGTPNAPTITATVIGNAIRIEFPIVIGTKIKGYRLYRGTGTSVPFPTCTAIDELSQPKSDVAIASSNMQFEDSSFSSYQKEQGQAFTYYVTTVNERGDESAASNAQSLSCRLDSPDDTENGGRLGLKNYFFNAMFGGTQAGLVLDTDAAQDTGHFTFVDGGYTPGVPGRPYGGNGGQLDGTNRYKGYTHWAGTKTGGAPTNASFVNNNEIKMPAPGTSQSVYVFQEIGAWDELLGGGRGARFAKMKKNGFVVFQIKIRYDVGAMPNGGVRLIVEQYNNNTLIGNAKRQYRDTGSNLVFATGVSSNFDVAGSVLPTNGSFATFWAVYQFDAALGTTKQIRFTYEHHDTNNGNPFYICEPMVNDGTDRGAWTADMADPYLSLPAPGNPPGEPDRDGRRQWDKFA